MKTYEVILERGDRGNLTWTHQNVVDAERRVAALCILHGCKYTRIDNTFTVHGSAWYKPKEAAR